MHPKVSYGSRFNLALGSFCKFLLFVSIWVFFVSAYVTKGAVASSQFDDAHDAYLNGELTKARDLFLPLAEASNVKAQFYLGVIYGLEFYDDRDPDLSRHWVLKAVERGDPHAAIYTCLNFLDGSPEITEFVSRHRKAMVQAMTRAEESMRARDWRRSYSRFSYFALAKLAGLSSEAERLKYARLAREKGRPWGSSLLADLLLDKLQIAGRSADELKDEVLEIMVNYMLDAYAGYPPAQFGLGRLILRGVDRSEEGVVDAWTWILWSSGQGYGPATDFLAAWYEAVPERVQDLAETQLNEWSEQNAQEKRNRSLWCEKNFGPGSDGLRVCNLATSWHHLACILPRELGRPLTSWRLGLYAKCRQHMMTKLNPPN